MFKRANADERERQRRNDAYRLSYRVIEYSMPLVAFLFFLWAPQIEDSDWIAVWFVTFSFVVFLPYMVFAWREPDVVD